LNVESNPLKQISQDKLRLVNIVDISAASRESKQEAPHTSTRVGAPLQRSLRYRLAPEVEPLVPVLAVASLGKLSFRELDVFLDGLNQVVCSEFSEACKLENPQTKYLSS
jgi:hypothetical protein